MSNEINYEDLQVKAEAGDLEAIIELVDGSISF